MLHFTNLSVRAEQSLSKPNLKDGSRLPLAILSRLGGRLGPPEALLEPSWAILDALTPRGAARPGPGEGVGGGVKLLPWRKSSGSFPPTLPTRK